jgi:hypothetical protein
MKKIFFAFAVFVLFVESASSQVLDPVQYVYPKWYNEAGTQVTGTSAYLTGTASAIGDTFSTQKFALDADEIKFSLSLGVGDSMRANLHVQFGTGPISGTSWYAPGGIALTAKSDSIISLGVRQMIVGQTCKVAIRRNAVGWTSTPGGSAAATGGLRDSTHTLTFEGGLNSGAYTWVRFVLIFHSDKNDVSNGSILTGSSVVIIKRRYSSW